MVSRSPNPYSFGPQLGELDMHLFSEGNHRQIGRVFGSQVIEVDGVQGVRFAVWAPNARRVSVVGSFNGWDGRRHPMRLRFPSGVWELFIPRLQPGDTYKYEILGPNGILPLKADPSHSPPSIRREPHRSSPGHWIISGRTGPGCNSGPRASPSRRR